MQRREEDRNIDRRIKCIKGKFRKPGTTLVTKQQTDGSILEIIDKPPLKKVIIEENLKNYHQAEGALPLFDDPSLYRYIGAFVEGKKVEDILEGTYVFPDNTKQAVKILLRHLQRPKNV